MQLAKIWFLSQILFIINVGADIRKLLKFRKLYLQKIRNIEYERNRATKFLFETLSTKLQLNYEQLPSSSDEPNILKLFKGQMKGLKLCKAKLKVKGQGTLCLYSDGDKESFEIEFSNGESYNLSSLQEKIKMVKGFVVGAPSSVVKGYLIGGAFYGSIRLRDKLRGYNTHLYIEPLSNSGLYAKRLRNVTAVDSNDNAIIFEYISHEDASHSLASSRKLVKSKAFKRASKEEEVSLQIQTVLRETLHFKDSDFGAPVEFKESGKNDESGNLFDSSSSKHFSCPLCIWLESEFAEAFGLSSGPLLGASELYSVLKLASWIFRAQDFNVDGRPDNLGLTIKSFKVSNDFSIGLDKSSKVQASEAYARILAKIKLQPKYSECCAILGFIYQNLSPSLSASTLRGICSGSNLALITGRSTSGKLGLFDILRSTLHALGHLFGGRHDPLGDPSCDASSYLSKFLNPTLMDIVPQSNVALRPNSLRYSSCALRDVAVFLSSGNVACLKAEVKGQAEPFCGNGILEEGEDCDCGDPATCAALGSCCGESDSLLGCRRLDSSSRKVLKGTSPSSCKRVALRWALKNE